MGRVFGTIINALLCRPSRPYTGEGEGVAPTRGRRERGEGIAVVWEEEK